jgi:small subunit ribosomal protein S13
MASIAGVELPRNKPKEVALTYVYGIGRNSAPDICTAAGVDAAQRTDDVSDDLVAQLRREIESKY